MRLWSLRQRLQTIIYAFVQMTPDQCRMGRAAVQWSQADLARAAKVRQETVSGFEGGNDSRRSTVSAMQAALESAGVVFIGPDETSLSGGPGARLRGSA